MDTRRYCTLQKRVRLNLGMREMREMHVAILLFTSFARVLMECNHRVVEWLPAESVEDPGTLYACPWLNAMVHRNTLTTFPFSDPAQPLTRSTTILDITRPVLPVLFYISSSSRCIALHDRCSRWFGPIRGADPLLRGKPQRLRKVVCH